jgi:hypothetical protein
LAWMILNQWLKWKHDYKESIKSIWNFVQYLTSKKVSFWENGF